MNDEPKQPRLKILRFSDSPMEYFINGVAVTRKAYLLEAANLDQKTPVTKQAWESTKSNKVM
jgi:hypothetical protein